MTMPSTSLAEWQAECRERFPMGRDRISFACPACGNVASVAEFEALGLDADHAAKECLGRHSREVDCDWAAYGLFKTLGKGRVLELPDGGTVEVFEFADRDAPRERKATP